MKAKNKNKSIDKRSKTQYTVEDLLEKFGKKYPEKKNKKR